MKEVAERTDGLSRFVVLRGDHLQIALYLLSKVSGRKAQPVLLGD